MTEVNSINASTVGIVGNTGTSFTGTAVTNHNVILGGSTSSTLTNVAPSATSGIPLVSNGSSANPSFTTAVVAGGGTGNTTFTAYSIIASGTTSTGALQNVSGVGTAGQVLTSAGAGALPTWSSPGSTVSITSVAIGASPYTVLSTDQFLACQSTGGAITIKLPNAPTTGRTITIKDSNGDAATNNISITTVGGTVTIDGQTTYTMVSNYSAIQVVFDGSNYEVC